MAAQNITLGQMRGVIIARREQRPDPDGPGSIDVLVNVRRVKARVRPVGTMTFLTGVQLGDEITHKIVLRWRDDIDLEDVIFRPYTLPDGSQKQDTYKIRRWADKEGNHRWLELDVVLEREVRA